MGINNLDDREHIEQQANNNFSSCIGKILQIGLPENLKTTGLAIVVHHGETDGNLGKNATEGKPNGVSLNEKGKSEILEIAKILKDKIKKEDRKKIRIHVNNNVTRNEQTAKIIKKELGINPDQIIDSKDLRSQDKVYDENHKLIRQEFFSSTDHEGKSESIPKLRSMAANYVSETVKTDPELIHIFVTNRVSYKGFENWANKDLNAIHDYNLKTGIMRIVPVNSEGKPLNYVDPNLPISEQENQIKLELSSLASDLNIQNIDEFSDNLFDKDNRLRLRFLDFCKIGIKKGYSNIMISLFSKYPNLLEKTIKTLLPEIHDEKGKKFIDSVVLGYFRNIGICKDNEKLSLSLLNALHENNGNWKYLFRKLYLYNTEILLQNLIMEKDDALSYYETLQKQSENNKEYQSKSVEIFSGDMERDNFFVPINLKTSNDEIFTPDSLINDIINGKSNGLLIEGGAGSGKSILTKYLAKNLSDSKFGNNWVKMIDLDNLINVSYDELNGGIPDNFDGKKIFIFDGLDEKDKIKVDKLIDIVNNNQDKNAIFICSSRFFDDKKDNDNSCLKYTIQDINSIQSKEIIEKYTKNSDKKQEFENIIYPILQKIPDKDHSPLVITMLISIVEYYIDNDEYYEIFDKKEIKLSEIYDTFIKFLHNRENSKKKLNKERTKEENKFMSKKWDNLRIEFLKYLSLFNGGYGQQDGFFPKGEFAIDNIGERNYSKGQLRNIFYHRIDYMEYEGKEPSYKTLSKEDIDSNHQIAYDFIDSLANYGLLKCDKPKGYYFPHKSFQEYFGYKNLDVQKSNGESMVLSLISDKLLRKNRELNETEKMLYTEYCANVIFSYSFNNKYKAFNILGKIKDELSNRRGLDLRYYDDILINVAGRVLDEIIARDELTYDYINNVVKFGDKFAPNLLEYIKNKLDFHVHIVPGDKKRVDNIKYKLNNPDEFLGESLKTDLKELEAKFDYPEYGLNIFRDYTAASVLFSAFFDWHIA